MGISIWQLIIVLAIVLLLFGTKKLKNLGSDLGGAIRGFKKAVKEGEEGKDDEDKLESTNQSKVIEGEITSRDKEKDKV